MSYFEYAPYVPVAERRKTAERAAAKARKAGTTMNGVAAFRGAIAKTVWGKAWCANLEHYGDFANRLPRGRTYVRGGAVIDLILSDGEVTAKVMGSHLYTVKVRVAKVQTPLWRSMSADCSGSISSLVELLQGKLSSAVMERMCRPREGLFPAPQELIFDCSCADGANLCKHVAAALYGIGARLDHTPELLFALRGVDAKDLVEKAAVGLTSTGKKSGTARVLTDASLADVFGLEMAEPVAAIAAPVAAKAKVAAPKNPTKAVPKAPAKIVAKAKRTATATTAAAEKKLAPVAQKPKTKITSKNEIEIPPEVVPAKRKTRNKSA